MPLVDAKDLLGHAGRHGYAVCAFDLASLDFLAAAVQAAENCRAPVILSIAEPHLEYLAAEYFLPAVEAAARRARVPVAIQFNRAASVASVARAISLGCNSIVVNAPESALVLEEYVASTRAVVEMAHACGVPVEGGLNGIAHRPGERHAALAEVREYVERSGVDFLVITTGQLPPRTQLDFARLAQIRAALALPLTVDAVKEFTDAEYRQLIENGVVKINHYAGLSRAAGERLRRNLRSSPRNGYLRLMTGVQQALGAEVERCLRLAGGAGRADSALAHCRPRGGAVEHCILYNVAPGEGEHQARAVMASGRQTLGAIPGVRGVFTGRALRPDAKYRYCWLVRFAAPEVIAGYRAHPDHMAFADGRFLPLAPDPLSIDFEEVS